MTDYSDLHPNATGDEWEFEVKSDDESQVIRISKVGGGTEGNAYVGWWHWEHLSKDGDVILGEGSDLHTGTAKTHEQAAGEVAAFLNVEDEFFDLRMNVEASYA